MKTLIIGGAGYLGSNIANAITGEITVIDNLSTGNLDRLTDTVNFYVQDISDIELLKNLLNKLDIEVVFYCINHSNIDEILTYISALDEITKIRISKFILFSKPEADSHNLIYKWIEDYTVLKFEKITIPYLIVRVPQIYGELKPDQYHEVGTLSYYLKEFKNNPDPIVEVHGDGEEPKQAIYITDVLNSLKPLAMPEVEGLVNLYNPQIFTTNDFLDLLAVKFNKTPTIKYKEPQKPSLIVNKNNATYKLYGWEPRHSLEEGVDLIINYAARDRT